MRWSTWRNGIGWRSESLQGFPRQAADAPVGLQLGAETAVEAEGEVVPGENRPVHAAAAPVECDAGQGFEEEAADPGPSGGRADEEVFEVETLATRPRREVIEEEGETGRFTALARDEDLRCRVVPEQGREEVGVGSNRAGRLALIRRQLADQLANERHVGGGGRRDRDRG